MLAPGDIGETFAVIVPLGFHAGQDFTVTLHVPVHAAGL